MGIGLTRDEYEAEIAEWEERIASLEGAVNRYKCYAEDRDQRIAELEAEVERLREALDNIADGIIPGIDYGSTGERMDSLMSGYARHVLKDVE